MATEESNDHDDFFFLECCTRGRCDETGTAVAKLPEWNRNGLEVDEDDEEEIAITLRGKRNHAETRMASVESWSSMGRLRPKDLDFSELTREGQHLRIKRENRGINFEQLKKILVFVKKRCDKEEAIRGWYDHLTGEQLFYRSMTLAQLQYWLIHPLSLRYQCSYVEAIAKKDYAQLPAWFVGHSWDEPVVDFVRRVMKNGTLGAGDAFWCLPFATRASPSGWQCQEMLVSGELSVEPFRTLQHLKIQVRHCSRNSLEELQHFLPVELDSLELVISDSPKLLDLGALLHSAAAAHTQRTVLAPLRHLHLRVEHSTTQLASVELFGRSLRAMQLQVLELSLSGCDLSRLGGTAGGATDTALLPLPQLEELTVDVSGCRKLEALEILSGESQALRKIHLRLADCLMLTTLEDLLRPLGSLKAWTDLELNVAGCECLRSLGELSQHLRAQEALERLRLNLSGCISLPEQIFQDLDATLRDLEELDGTRDVLVVGMEV